MAWLQLRFSVEASEAEQLSTLLEQTEVSAISLEAASNQGIVDLSRDELQLWQQTRITALFSERTDIERVLERLSLALAPKPLPSYELISLEERDWASTWKEQFVPMRFGQNLWVHPSWIEPPDPLGINLILDPGMAFGTGAHATTALCLEWLTRSRAVAGARVIDYGCGSGILALAAAKLGAERVWAVDIDPLALAVTRENASKNRVSEHIITVTPAQLECGPVDIVLANILAGPLCALAWRLAALTAVGGQLVLSGILAEQAGDCIAAYQSWFAMDPPEHAGEWVLLHGIRQKNKVPHPYPLSPR